MVLRPYARLEAIYNRVDTCRAKGRLDGAPAGLPDMTFEIELPDLLASVSAGLELYNGDAWTARLEYDGQFGDHFQGQQVSARLAWTFLRARGLLVFFRIWIDGLFAVVQFTLPLNKNIA